MCEKRTYRENFGNLQERLKFVSITKLIKAKKSEHLAWSQILVSEIFHKFKFSGNEVCFKNVRMKRWQNDLCFYFRWRENIGITKMSDRNRFFKYLGTRFLLTLRLSGGTRESQRLWNRFFGGTLFLNKLQDFSLHPEIHFTPISKSKFTKKAWELNFGVLYRISQLK